VSAGKSISKQLSTIACERVLIDFPPICLILLQVSHSQNNAGTASKAAVPRYLNFIFTPLIFLG
jgi:hypothetical protein